MAILELVIHDVTSYVDTPAGKIPNESNTLSIKTNSSRGVVSYIPESGTAGSSQNESATQTCGLFLKSQKGNIHEYALNITKINFTKKMYQPTEVVVNFSLITLGQANTQTGFEPVSRSVLNEAFHHCKVSLLSLVDENTTEKDKKTIGNDYYVYEIEPRYTSDSMFLTMKIYSVDKMLTLDIDSTTFVAKKFASDVIPKGLEKYPLPYDSKEKISFDSTNMKVLAYKKGTEHIFPYLVQYNESFYDMMKRTANRWAEFLYYEKGKLHLGYNDEITKKFEKLPKGYELTYGDVETAKKDNIGGQYALEAAYDENFLANSVEKSPNEPQNLLICKPENGLDKAWLNLFPKYFGLTKNIATFLGNVAFDEIYGQIEAARNVSHANEVFNEKFFVNSGKTEQYNNSTIAQATTYNPFSEIDSKFNSTLYLDMVKKERFASKNAIHLNCSTNYPDMLLGDVIRVYGTDYIVTEVTCVTNPHGLKVNNDQEIYVSTEMPTLNFQVTAIAGWKKEEEKKTDDKTDNKTDGKTDGTTGDKTDNTADNTAGNNTTTTTTTTTDAKKATLPFYPPMLASGHIKSSGPQLATVADADDPQNQNRVRLRFDWQGNSSDPSPWVVYATSSASKSNGIFGKHYQDDKVIVNFAGGNIERPYVVGGLAMKGNKVPGSLAERDIVLSSPGGHNLKMDDGSGAGATAFLTGALFPMFDFLTLFFPGAVGKDMFGDSKTSKAFEGGFELTDKYGIYKISGSSNERNVTVKSPWGDVNINAFTGITISAPNGDISIKGKNISIEAGNNLELISGGNVDYKAYKRGDDGWGSLGFFGGDIALAAAKKLAEKVKIIDMTLIRSMIEVWVRPVEGALTVKSNRYLKLEAGKSECDYPKDAYTSKEQNRLLAKSEKALRKGLKVGPGMVELFEKVKKLAEKLDGNYRDLYNACVDKYSGRGGFKSAVREAVSCASGNDRAHIKVCKTIEEMKDALWAEPPYKKLSEDVLGFDAAVMGLEASNVDQHAIEACRNAHRAEFSRLSNPPRLADQQAIVINHRKASRRKILDALNELREAICNFKKFDTLSRETIGGELGWFWTTSVPENYLNCMLAAFNKDKLNKRGADNEPCFYFAEITDEQKKLEKKYKLNNQAGAIDLSADLKCLKRRAYIILLEELGFKDEWRQAPPPPPPAPQVNVVPGNAPQANPVAPQVPPVPFKKNDIILNEKWNPYVDSIVAVPKLTPDEFAAKKLLFDSLKGAIDLDNFAGLAQTVHEQSSWSNAKNGGILFTDGDNTYKLGNNISAVEGAAKENLLSTEDNNANTLLTDVKRKLGQ